MWGTKSTDQPNTTIWCPIRNWRPKCQSWKWQQSTQMIDGKNGVGTINGSGEKLENLFSTNGLVIVIGGTILKHKKVHKITWNSQNNPDKNRIDHMIINGKWRRALVHTKAYIGADVKSDQHLVIAKLRLKFKKSFDNNKSRGKSFIPNVSPSLMFKENFV